MADVTSLLDREVYLYAEVDKLVGLAAGTARRWINGYSRGGKFYEPILRRKRRETDWVTWGEFVEARMLAEYRDEAIQTHRLRAAVENLRETFGVDHPLAYLQPYLAAASGELAIDQQRVHPSDPSGQMVVTTRQLLLAEPSRDVMERAGLDADDYGRPFAAELSPDKRFLGIVVNPDRFSGQPTFAGRRVSVDLIAGMAAAGERPSELAASYGLSLAQIQAAVDYTAEHGRAA